MINSGEFYRVETMVVQFFVASEPIRQCDLKHNLNNYYVYFSDIWRQTKREFWQRSSRTGAATSHAPWPATTRSGREAGGWTGWTREERTDQVPWNLSQDFINCFVDLQSFYILHYETMMMIIIFYFGNVAFFHAKLGSGICPRVDNQTSGDT